MQAQAASDSPRRGKGGRGAYLQPRLQNERASGHDRPPAETRSNSPLARKRWIGGDANKIQDHESRIGPWLACFANPSSLSSFRNRRHQNDRRTWNHGQESRWPAAPRRTKNGQDPQLS